MGPQNLTILLVPVPLKATKVSALKNYIGYAFCNLLFLRESTMAYGVVVKNMNLKKNVKLDLFVPIFSLPFVCWN